MILLAAAAGPAVAEDQKPGSGPSKSIVPKTKPAKKPAPKTDPGPPECMRVGQRVIAALARDDSGAARQFYDFYTAFKCPPQHLPRAFGCLVALQTTNPSLASPSPEHVTQCWEDPSTVPVVQPPPPATAPDEKK